MKNTDWIVTLIVLAICVPIIFWLMPRCTADQRLMKTLWNAYECVPK